MSPLLGTRVVHDLMQGTPEWHVFRLDHYGASEAAAMLGLSKKTTRSELLRMRFTGEAKEFSAWVQENILDHGHEVEARARPLVEAQIGQELYPVVVSMGKLSASSDGITMDDAILWEHKQFNKDLFAALKAGVLPDEHWPQCQQELLVNPEAEKIIFTCSDGTPDCLVTLDVYPNPAQQARIIAGWEQFEKDLAGYKLVDVTPSAVAAPIENLPALLVRLTGEVVSSNLPEYEAIIVSRIKAIKTDLVTDQDFADAEKMVGFLKTAEEKLALTKDHALAETASIAELFSAIDRMAEEARTKRLWLAKVVDARKISRRNEIMQAGKDGYAEHIAGLNQRLGRALLTAATAPTADFAKAIHGKRSFQNMVDAVDTMLANLKIETNAIADRLQVNLALVAAHPDHQFLFNDLDRIVFKATEDMTILVNSRISDHKAAEEKKLADERERIRKEEEAKATAKAEQEAREKAAKEQAEQAALQREQHDAALGEIKGIQQQTMIATMGRAGVRKGGTIECIRETLAETEAWTIDEAKFGALTGAAQLAKENSVAYIKALLVEAETPPAPKPAAVSTPKARASARSAAKPSDADIIAAVATHFSVDESRALEWLRAIDYEAASQQLAA